MERPYVDGVKRNFRQNSGTKLVDELGLELFRLRFVRREDSDVVLERVGFGKVVLEADEQREGGFDFREVDLRLSSSALLPGDDV